MLSKQLGVKQFSSRTPNLGRALTPEEIQLFKDDQVAQLYELMQEAKKPKVDPEEAPGA